MKASNAELLHPVSPNLFQFVSFPVFIYSNHTESALLERKTRLRMAGMKDVSEHPCPSSLQRNLDQLNDTKKV